MRLPALPSGIGGYRYSASIHLQVVSAIACASCALAGAWPRFMDSAPIRLVIAVSSAMFGALVIRVALGAKSRAGAVGRALGLSTIFGWAATILPSLILAVSERGSNGPGVFMLGIVFGIFFGAPTGLSYGLFLALLVGVTYRNVETRSFDGWDRAARTAGLWLVVPTALSLVPSLAYDLPRVTGGAHLFRDDPGVAVPLALLASTLALSFALCSALWGHLRIVRRRRWLAAVRDGRDGTFRLRDVDPRDDTRKLPVLTPGMTVLEWVPDARTTSAYRDAPLGVAVALVGERPLSR